MKIPESISAAALPKTRYSDMWAHCGTAEWVCIPSFLEFLPVNVRIIKEVIHDAVTIKFTGHGIDKNARSSIGVLKPLEGSGFHLLKPNR